MVFNESLGSKCRENIAKLKKLNKLKTASDIHISNAEILNGEKVNLFGVNLEGSLNFDFHVNTLLKEAGKT